jgi:hypothetical protein
MGTFMGKNRAPTAAPREVDGGILLAAREVKMEIPA